MITAFADTETTNLRFSSLANINKQPHIYEYYHITTEDLETHCWINPGISIPKESTKITGITDENVKDCELFEFHAPAIRESIEGCDEIWFHNASYDCAVINDEFTRIGQKIDWPRVRCSVEETEWIKGFRLNLTALHDFLFEWDFEGHAHSAKWDVLALRRCVLELKERGLV